MSTLKVNAIRSTSASSDAITLDGSGNITLPGNLTVTGTTNIETDIRKDLNMLALHTAIDNNKAAYNLNDTFIDQFEDSSKITLTDCGRETDEYITSINYKVTTNISEGHAGGNNSLGSTDQSDATSYTGYDGVTRSKGFMDGDDIEDLECFNLKYIFTGDFEVIVYMRGRYHSVGYLHGADVDDLDELDYKAQSGNSTYWGPSNTAFDSHPGTFAGCYHAPVASTGNNDYRTLYRFHRSGNTFQIQYTGHTSSDITIDATSIAELRASTTYAHTIGGPTTISTPMVIGWGIGDPDTSPQSLVKQQIEVANAGVLTDSATATCQGSAITATSSRTKVSGVMLYKDASGTNTIGTDLKIYFTCNGGTNWTEAASYTAGSDFSTGIKTIHLGETTCTEGADIRYKAVWANQSDGSKEAQLHGIGVNY